MIKSLKTQAIDVRELQALQRKILKEKDWESHYRLMRIINDDKFIGFGEYDNGRLVGYVSGASPSIFWTYCSTKKLRKKKMIYMDSIGVLKEYRGKGIGTKLLKRFKIDARAKGFNYIVSHTSNPVMAWMFKRNGFMWEKRTLYGYSYWEVICPL